METVARGHKSEYLIALTPERKVDYFFCIGWKNVRHDEPRIKQSYLA